MPHTTGLTGWLNKIFSVFHRGEKTASEDFKDRLKALQALKPEAEANKTSQIEETETTTPTPGRPSL